MIWLPIRENVIFKSCGISVIIYWYPVVYPYFVICNVKKLAVKLILVSFIVGYCTDGVVIILLLVIHVCAIAKVLFNEPLVMPVHIVPNIGNEWVFSKFFVQICFFLVLFLLLLNVLKNAINVKPVA